MLSYGGEYLVTSSSSNNLLALFSVEHFPHLPYLYARGPDLDTANLGRGLGPVLPEVEPSTNFARFRLEL